jgi:hypothetical protein
MPETEQAGEPLEQITDPIVRRAMESVRTFWAAIDRLGLPAMTSACELTQLDRLVRKYPHAARKSLALYDQEQRFQRWEP